MPSSLRRALLPVLLCTVASGARAQRAAGAGEDAYVVPRGTVRLGLGLDFSGWDERFTPSSRREALGAPLTGELTLARVAPGTDFATRLQALTGSGTALTLGRVHVAASARAMTLPLTAELGVARWMSVGVTVPFVRTRTAIVADADSAPLTANAGLNPSLTSADARATNALLVSQLLTAARNRESAAGIPENGCATSSDAACALVNEVRTAADDLAAVYGTTNAAPAPGSRASFSPVVPLLESSEHALVAARIAGLKQQLGPDGGVITVAAPAAASVPIGSDALATLVADPVAGLAYDPFRLVERVHVGDIELAARVRLFDRIGMIGDARPRHGLAMRSAVTALVRLPTGQGESDANLLDVGTGDGQLDVELRGALDLLLGRSVWVTGVARVNRQLADEQFVRAPFAVGEALTPRSNLQRVRRDLGDIVEVEATPRWMPSDYLTIAAQYRMRTRGEDSYESVAITVPGLAPLLGAGTKSTSHAVGLGFTYSTHAAVRRGLRSLPLDVTYQHLRVVRATDGYTPAVVSDQLRLRVWTRLGGR